MPYGNQSLSLDFCKWSLGRLLRTKSDQNSWFPALKNFPSRFCLLWLFFISTLWWVQLWSYVPSSGFTTHLPTTMNIGSFRVVELSLKVYGSQGVFTFPACSKHSEIPRHVLLFLRAHWTLCMFTQAGALPSALFLTPPFSLLFCPFLYSSEVWIDTANGYF